MKIENLSKFLSIIILSLIFVSSFYFGNKYSIFNTDFHHYSIVLETYLDKKNGFELNKDIFVTYGNGQIYLFQILSNFFDINLYSIGIITQFFFSLKFIIFYLILKFFFNNYYSIFGTLIYYFFYTFAQTASSDILASFFIHLFVFVYLYNFKKQNIYLILLSSLLIFTIILFRHTYILNIIIIIFSFLILNFFISENLKYEKKINRYFLLIFISYIIFLHINGNLIHWFNQFFTLGLNNFLTIGLDNEMDFFSRISTLFYYFARIGRHILFPNTSLPVLRNPFM